ncbi:MAG TPA: ATP-binding protein [Cellulomonas sp.]
MLENATLFSEPGTPVVVSTGVQGDLVTVEVIDQGLGMSPEELVEANTTIAATAATDAIGAQRLGLFVVARLARRLGADVRLERAAGPHSSSGTVAVVSFPSALFTSNDPALSGPAVPASRTVSGPEAGAIPAPPVAVPVDLAALTDGATSTGLPKRRVSGEQSPVEAAAARSTMPTEQDVVLPAPTETTLAPEIAAAAAEWTPQVSATGPAALPSRSSALPTRGGGDALPSRAPVEPAAPVAPAEAAPAPSGPRSGLFAGFRGRDVLPQLTELPVPEETPAPSVLDLPLPAAAPEVAAAADPLDGYTFRTADDLAGPLTAGLDEPTSGGWHLDPDAAPVVAPVAEDEPASGPEPAVQPAAFVVPGLVPDETLDESRAWAWPGADQSVAPEQPAETMAALPVAPGWEAPSDPSAAEPAAEVWAPTEPAEWSTPGGPVVHEQPAAFAPLPAYAPPADQVPADVAPFAAEPFVAPSAEPVAAAPEPGWTAAPAAWSAEPLAPAAPVTAAPAPATPVVAGPVSAPAPDADVAPLPDFASLVQGDGSEPAPMHRPRKKRSFFSFGSGKSRRVTAPTAQTAQTAPPVVPVLPPPVAPVAPVERPAWTPSAAWMPTEDVAPAVPAPLPAPTAPAGGWAGAPVPEPSATGAAGLPVAAQVFAPADVLPETFASAPTAEPAVPSSPARAPEADLAPSGLSAWAPQQAAEDAPAPIWSAPAATGTALPTRVPAAVPPPVPEPVSDPVERTAPPRNVSAWASAWSPEGSPAAPVSSWSSDPAGAAGGAPAQRSGALDAEAASMLALRADIQEQALSELSQLSAYRPTVVDRPANGSLTRRVPTAIPAAPEITHEAGAAASRDADGLRDRLSDFQSGTRRGRRAQAGSESGEVPAPGSEPNPSEPQPSSPTW